MCHKRSACILLIINYHVAENVGGRKHWWIQLFGLLRVQNFGKFSSPLDLKDKDRIFEGENLGDCRLICQIRQCFLLPTFCTSTNHLLCVHTCNAFTSQIKGSDNTTHYFCSRFFTLLGVIQLPKCSQGHVAWYAYTMPRGTHNSRVSVEKFHLKLASLSIVIYETVVASIKEYTI